MNAWGGPGPSTYAGHYSPDGRWFWTGSQWTPVGVPGWKGARYGRPASGSGSLANPGRRLGARLLDGLVLLPVSALIIVAIVVFVAPHVGPVFPAAKTASDAGTSSRTPGFVWLELAIFAGIFVLNLVQAVYETVAVARYGRTLGKAWLGIRIVRTDGSPLDWGRAAGRTGLYFVMGWIGVVGLVNELWCLWDEDRQCLHDKAVGTLVVND